MRTFKSKSNSKYKWFIQLIEIVRLGLKINTSLGFIEKNYTKHKYSEIFKIKRLGKDYRTQILARTKLDRYQKKNK